MRHERDKRLLSLDFHIIQFRDGAAIRFVQFHPEMGFVGPANLRFLDDERMLGGRNQQHQELHPDGDQMGAPQAASSIRQIFGHAAGMEIPVGIVDGARNGSPDIASLVWVRGHNGIVSTFVNAGMLSRT